MKGVISTQVGYAGGKKPDPTYYNMMDHTESVEITYDEREISYGELLNVFWKNHHPFSNSPCQYRSVIFYFTEEQKKIAEKSQLDYEESYGMKTKTKIEPMSETQFFRAEEYHQKYLDQH